MVELTAIDLDYIEFLAQRRGVAPEAVREQYAAVKERFQFAGREYRQFCVSIHDLLSPVYSDSSEAEIITSLQFHAAIHLYRHISYAYWKLPHLQKYAKAILGAASSKPLVVVDYGAGLGHLSMLLAQICPGSYVYLVDIDGMVLDFAEFRFRKAGLNFESIRVTQECVYPDLPEHDVCIVTEVWEHLKRPLVAYENVCQALVTGGLLVGKISDHGKEFFHVSPKLGDLRARLVVDFEMVTRGIHRKR